MQYDSVKNGAIAAPGLAVYSTTPSLVYWANTFQFKSNGRLSGSVTTTQAPSLAGATLRAPYPNGTAGTAGVLATKFYRIYTLVADLSLSGTNSPTPTYSWYASADYDNVGDVPNLSNAVVPTDKSTSAVIGFVIIQNNTGSNFTPGTTSLSTGSLTVTYIDNTTGLL